MVSPDTVIRILDYRRKQRVTFVYFYECFRLVNARFPFSFGIMSDSKFPLPREYENKKRTDAITIRCKPDLKTTLHEVIPNARARAEWINEWLEHGVKELGRRKAKV